jgi:hypothetical protein
MRSEKNLDRFVRGALDSVRAQATTDVIYAEKIRGREFARIAMDNKDLLLLLPAAGDNRFRPVRLARLLVDFRVHCQVIDGAEALDEHFTILRVREPDELMQGIFCDVVALLLKSMNKFDDYELHRLVLDMVEFFKAMNGPSDSTILGLWGELFVIFHSSDPDVLGEGWHVSSMEKFDFSVQEKRLEVKTTPGPRRHHFSLEQVRNTPGIEIMVASIIVNESQSGTNLLELLALTETKLKTAKTREHVRRVALRTLGASYSADDLRSYDLQSAAMGIRFFPSEVVPQPIAPHFGVSDVRFVADLQLVGPASPEEVRNWGTLGRALTADT